MFCDKLSHPLEYRDKLGLMIARNAVVGFGSMAFYDIMLGLWRGALHSNSSSQSHSVLLGECNSRTLMKGLHGMMFCTFSNLFKLFYEQKNLI